MQANANMPTVDAALLDLLLRAEGHRTVQALAQVMGRSPQDIALGLEALEHAGCLFESHPGSGVRLVEAGLGTWQDYLQWRLDPIRRSGGGPAWHRVIEVYSEVASTQDAARRVLSARGCYAHGALIAADHQRAGRGRLGRRWLAPRGSGATFSYIHVDGAIVNAGTGGPPSTSPRVPAGVAPDDWMWLSAAVAVAEAIDALAPSHAPTAQIKWPNDVLLDGKKVAGILIETAAGPNRSAIIGIGINVGLHPGHLADMPADVAAGLGSLAMHAFAADRLDVIATVAAQLESRLSRGRVAETLAAWRSRCVQLGSRLHLRCDGRDIHGVVVDVDPVAGLIVRTETGALVHLPAATATVCG